MGNQLSKKDRNPQTLTRRTFLKIGGMGAAVILAGDRFGKFTASADSTPPRRLVVLEMNGGNDGLNTVIPYGDGSYYDVRGALAIPQNQVLKIDNMWGLHPSLTTLKQAYERGTVAIIRGVGHTDPDLSHFKMQDIWRAGDPNGSVAENNTGWAGRMLEFLTLSAAPLAAISIYTSVGPVLNNPIGKAVSAQSPSDGNLNYPGGLDQTIRQAMSGLGQPGSQDSAEMQSARQGLSDSLVLSDFLNGLGAPSSQYPSSNTANQLSFAATVMAANDWIRIIHVPLPLDHDTHVDQAARQTNNLGELDAAVTAFVADLSARGLLDQTLIMTVSEFGRRVDVNGSAGTDHGTASAHFVIGSAVKGGLYGDPPSLTNLDPNGNLVSSSSFLDLEATACAWMGVDPTQVLPAGTAYSGMLTS